ncbi:MULTISPECIES: glutamate synthase subunit beta [Shouchella]|uniref:Glutamate synthase subunit beta n=2 Tax=Shouchella TaxID=2893057 RepID=A0A268P694_SHOCL|nr:glutamate synthase subunit beta [Shouchella clausii]KKI84634.1 glutamate synthase [Shouchella clausii]MBX0319654.1 glutamate synthase subunit beta [Shouchella clausii]PAD19630.1 glutamate synthase subunit beta [Shouchella clausii]PAD45204.1 glutamate synthase subunit beta [Shouchella clausii]PAE84776.1 glutamate synthase subunit beta [Shouchella clausii]
MGKPTGFLEYKREAPQKKDPFERTKNWQEFQLFMPEDKLRQQGARCMDCAIPFCQAGTTMAGSGEIGCPVYNLIPEWNDLVYRGKWREALDRLHKTNNFPEFTGRVCPAPCEGSCTVALNGDPVTIKSIEYHIVERGFQEGWIQPEPPKTRTGKHVAVVGSGPAGLAAAAQLNKAGHTVTVFERDDRIGGLLTYGIPDVKLANEVVERRVQLLEAEGITFKTEVEIGVDITAEELETSFDAVILATGATKPREVQAPGKELNGIHYAMDFLTANTKSLLNSQLADGEFISAKGKHVIVIGGGDTGADCITTSIRHGAASVTQFDINKQKGAMRSGDNVWPLYPIIHTVEDAHKEAMAVYGKDPRSYMLQTKAFFGNQDGQVTGLQTVEVTTELKNGQKIRTEIPGTERTWKADLILLAIGFTGPEQELLQQLGIETTSRTTVKAPYGKYTTSKPGIFAAGDNRRGQSLVVWAIHEGREAARECDRYLMGSTRLP